MTVSQLEAFLDREFPQLHWNGRIYSVEAVEPLGCRMKMAYHESLLRPGGTISGPAMMALADLALYVAVLGAIGPVGLTVTTNLSINFLRKPGQDDVLAHCRLLKLGQRLAMGEVVLHAASREDEPVAHATGTYSIPPRR